MKKPRCIPRLFFSIMQCMNFLILSALCYVLPFWQPTAWPLIFLFPLFTICAIYKKISLINAFGWGTFVFAGHAIPIADALYHMIQKTFAIKLLPGALLLTYGTIVCTAWIWCSSRLSTRHLKIASLWLFLLFLQFALLLPFGHLEGNILMNPAIIMPIEIVHILPHIGMIVFLLLFATLGFSPYCLLALAMPFILYTPQKVPAPEWLNSVTCLPIMINGNSTAILESVIQQNQHIKTLLLPESACSQIPSINTPINLITGAFELHEGYRRNVACFKRGAQMRLYGKAHCLPIAEYLPWHLNWSWLQGMFATTLPTKACANERPRWQLQEGIFIVPYICSELFFLNHPDDSYSDPILLLCNDWWFCYPYFKRLMALSANLQAISWQRPILYVSYTQEQFFDQFGHAHSIQRL